MMELVHALRTRLAGTDRGLLIVAVLAFATSVADSSIVPLLPAVRRSLHLSPLETGSILSATTLMMLAAAVPIGLAAGRFGSRRLLVASAIVLPASLLGQALATDLATFLVARAAFGISFGIVWTVGPALASAAGRGASGTGKVIAVSGLGWLVGPIVVGVLADLFGYRAPLVVLAVLTVPLAVAVARDRSVEARVPVGRLRDALGAARRVRALGGATLVTGLLGVVTGVGGLVAPLLLAANGLSAGAIGSAVALSAVVWIAAGALSTRLPSARIDVRLVGGASALLALAWLIPVASLSTLAIVGFLVLSAGVRAVLNTVTYALAGLNVPTEALAAPIVGVMNVAWASMALASPLAAGVVVSGIGAKWAFVATAAVGFAVAAWMLVPRRGLTAARA